MKRTSNLENGLLWLGASISLAEILAGTAYANMGLSGAAGAIFLGHFIGCVILFEVALVGAKKRENSMSCVSAAFGERGAAFFAVLNIVQLFGWTSIMIYDGALVAQTIAGIGLRWWCVVLGVLISLWVLLGLKRVRLINMVAVVSLLIFCLVLTKGIASGNLNFNASANSMSFWLGVELSIAMPISWLPLIADYTSKAENPTTGALTSVVAYGLGSCFMYLIGYGAASGGESDIARIVLNGGLGVGALVLALFSTVTTTFLDANSAGESATAVYKNVKPRNIAFCVVVLATAFTLVFNVLSVTNFLLLIGSVFVPMSAVMLSEYYSYQNDDEELYKIKRMINKDSQHFLLYFIIWAFGVAIYHFSTRLDFSPTVISFVFTFALTTLAIKIVKK